MKTNAVLVILESPNGRYWGFHFHDCASGKTVSAQITGGDSNIRLALTNDGRNWRSDVFIVTQTCKERSLFALPHAGCHPDELRKYVQTHLAA